MPSVAARALTMASTTLTKMVDIMSFLMQAMGIGLKGILRMH